MDIRPISDLRNKFTEISATVHEKGESVILTKNGYADMVVMSYEEYNRRQFENEIYAKLMEAEIEARSTTKRYTDEEVFAEAREMIRKAGEAHGV